MSARMLPRWSIAPGRDADEQFDLAVRGPTRPEPIAVQPALPEGRDSLVSAGNFTTLGQLPDPFTSLRL